MKLIGKVFGFAVKFVIAVFALIGFMYVGLFTYGYMHADEIMAMVNEGYTYEEIGYTVFPGLETVHTVEIGTIDEGLRPGH